MALISSYSLIYLCFFIKLVQSLSTAPVFIWSNTNSFTGRNIQELSSISPQDITNFLQHKDGSLSQYLSKAYDQPEVVIVFAGKSLSTEKVSSIAHSYESQPSGGALSHLKQFVETSKSSIVIPYASTSIGVMTEVVTPLVSGASSVIIVDGDGSSIGHLKLKFPYSTMTIDGLLSKMQNYDWEIYNNGKIDVIVIAFQSHENLNEEDTYKEYADDDAVIEKIVDRLQGAKYVGLYMSDQVNYATINVQEKIFYARSVDHFNAFEERYQQERDDLYTTNWPAGMIEALVVMAPFLLILFIGICCTFQLQSDFKFVHEKTILRKQ